MSQLQATDAGERKKSKKTKLEAKGTSNKRAHVDEHDEAQPKKSKKMKHEADPVNGDIYTVVDQDEAHSISVQEKKRRKKPRVEASSVVPEASKAISQDADEAETSGKSKKKKKKQQHAEALDGRVTDVLAGTLSEDRRSRDANGVASVDLSDANLEKHTPFTQLTASFYLALSPCAYNFPLEGMCAEHLSPLLLTFYPPLHGVVLNYSNARLSEEPDRNVKAENSHVLSKSIDEYGVSFAWLTADFTIFRPHKRTYLEGYVTLQNESLLGLVCYNFFNASIERNRLPQDWQWVENKNDMSGDREAGFFIDGEGKKIEGRLVFRARDFDATPSTENGGGTISIMGTLLSPAQDKAQDKAQDG